MYYKKITALCNYSQGCWLKLCNKFHQMQQINRIHTRSFMFVHLFCIWIQVKPSHHILPPLLKTTCNKQKYYYYSYYIYNVWSDFKIIKKLQRKNRLAVFLTGTQEEAFWKSMCTSHSSQKVAIFNLSYNFFSGAALIFTKAELSKQKHRFIQKATLEWDRW